MANKIKQTKIKAQAQYRGYKICSWALLILLKQEYADILKKHNDKQKLKPVLEALRQNAEQEKINERIANDEGNRKIKKKAVDAFALNKREEKQEEQERQRKADERTDLLNSDDTVSYFTINQIPPGGLLNPLTLRYIKTRKGLGNAMRIQPELRYSVSQNKLVVAPQVPFSKIPIMEYPKGAGLRRRQHKRK